MISKGECYNFVDRFINQPQRIDSIEQMVHKIFAKHDKDRSGYLEKPEVLKLLDEILIH